MDGTSIYVKDDVCRGCYLEKADNLSELLEPIWSNHNFVIRQDAECPVPGFYIISTRKHIHSFGDFSLEMAKEIGIIINRVRKYMSENLEILRVHIILEERLFEPHFHIWLLPLWPNIMKTHNIDPKVWNSNIRKYIELFNYGDNKEKIEICNRIMLKALLEDCYMNKLIIGES